MTESDRAALPGLLGNLGHELCCASLACGVCGGRQGFSYGEPHEHKDQPCDCAASRLSAGIAELLREAERGRSAQEELDRLRISSVEFANQLDAENRKHVQALLDARLAVGEIWDTCKASGYKAGAEALHALQENIDAATGDWHACLRCNVAIEEDQRLCDDCTDEDRAEEDARIWDSDHPENRCPPRE